MNSVRLRVFPDRGQHPAEGRVDDQPQKKEGENHDDQGEIIKPRRGVQVLREVDPDEPGIPPGQGIPLEDDRPDDLGEGQGQHGEVNLSQADAEKTDDQGPRRPCHGSGEKRQWKGEGCLFHEQGASVSADPEIGCLPERDQAGVPQHEVQADRKEAHDQDVRPQKNVKTGLGQGKQGQETYKNKEGQFCLDMVYRCKGFPRSPQGRRISTTAMRI